MTSRVYSLLHRQLRQTLSPQCLRRISSSLVVNHNEDQSRKIIKDGPGLQQFFTKKLPDLGDKEQLKETIPYLNEDVFSGDQRKVYFDVHGCQMNVNDTEIAWSILQQHGFLRTADITECDVVLIMTCSIREGAEQKIWKRLHYCKRLKTIRQKTAKSSKKPPVKIGILGCMAERLKEKIVEEEKMVDLVCGPDAYRDLPRMLDVTQSGQAAVNVLLSLDETYCDVMPVRLDPNSPSAFVSIMRGCDNMCTYCIVPFTRGRERSRPINSILDEIRQLSDQGIREITLLGQNVNSYRDTSEMITAVCDPTTQTSTGFSTVYKPKLGGVRFTELLDKVSLVDPEMRIRFTSPHPKDFPDQVLHLMQDRGNICNQIHLPAQSGSTAVLERMRRGYTRQAYIDLVHHIRHIIPDVALTSDFIAGFCGETEEDHRETVTLLKLVQYNFAYCYPYSMRQKTKAHHRLTDDVSQGVKDRRHMELITTFREQALELNTAQIGQIQLVLVEGESKRSSDKMAGRNDGNTKVIIEQPRRIPDHVTGQHRNIVTGDYVAVQISSATSQTLSGTPLYHSTIHAFSPQQHANTNIAVNS